MLQSLLSIMMHWCNLAELNIVLECLREVPILIIIVHFTLTAKCSCNKLTIVNICYSPAGRSVLGKTVPEVSSMARGRKPKAVLETEGTVSQYGPTKAGE